MFGEHIKKQSTVMDIKLRHRKSLILPTEQRKPLHFMWYFFHCTYSVDQFISYKSVLSFIIGVSLLANVVCFIVLSPTSSAHSSTQLAQQLLHADGDIFQTASEHNLASLDSDLDIIDEGCTESILEKLIEDLRPYTPHRMAKCGRPRTDSETSIPEYELPPCKFTIIIEL